MAELTTGVSWIAVIGGFVASFLLGWVWYGPLFGKQWAEGVGVELGSSDDMPMGAMVFQALATFCFAWLWGVTAANMALLTAILITVTIMLFIYSNGKYAKKGDKAIMIEVAYILAMAVVMFAFQAIF
ncbi:MAG: DUF1761 domain-containing protein [Rhodothermales bacterium]|nr:DUF1761 domain-containing protein [Rhodothermales bacterium]